MSKLYLFRFFLAYQIAFYSGEIEKQEKQVFTQNTIAKCKEKNTKRLPDQKVKPCDKVNTFKPSRKST